MANGMEERIEIREIKQALARIEQRLGELEGQKRSDYVTPDELAATLKTTPNNVYRKVRKGDIKALKVGRSYRIPMSQFAKA
jgi:excisionase family DNA binding protein